MSGSNWATSLVQGLGNGIAMGRAINPDATKAAMGWLGGLLGGGGAPGGSGGAAVPTAQDAGITPEALPAIPGTTQAAAGTPAMASQQARYPGLLQQASGPVSTGLLNDMSLGLGQQGSLNTAGFSPEALAALANLRRGIG